MHICIYVYIYICLYFSISIPTSISIYLYECEKQNTYICNVTLPVSLIQMSWTKSNGWNASTAVKRELYIHIYAHIYIYIYIYIYEYEQIHTYIYTLFCFASSDELDAEQRLKRAYSRRATELLTAAMLTRDASRVRFINTYNHINTFIHSCMHVQIINTQIHTYVFIWAKRAYSRRATELLTAAMLTRDVANAHVSLPFSHI